MMRSLSIILRRVLQIVSIYFLLHWTRAIGWIHMAAKSCKHQTFIRTCIGWIYAGKGSGSYVWAGQLMKT
ncbi:hypothetical protein HanIR_Chr15g0747481 [Helianthus annuus]|nr:hypothetical protein HanIR_Chr15g0747481 [Helianthus annuus]